MNVIDIVIIAIIAASVIYGLYRGFVQTLLSVACCLISIVVAFAYGPKVADMVSNNQGVSSTLATYTDAVTRVGDYSLASTPVSQLSDGVIQQVLDSVNLPESIASILRGNLKNQNFEGTGLNTVNDYVSNTVVAVAVSILSFIAVYAACYLALSIIVSLIKHVFELPLLKQMDWLAGGVFGLARGALLLYVVFLVIPILSTIIPMEDFNDMLAQSTLAPIFQSDGFFAQVIAGKIKLF
ncbi:MAG: CvpA family protein [Clostridia bacterium]|nr:CvpA family protein [Clostridia bacterium]MBQ6961438.1 CvpA family protein [Clostridia bacterium]